VREITTGPEWIHELKWDAYRLIARCESVVVYLWSRTGRNWAEDVPARWQFASPREHQTSRPAQRNNRHAKLLYASSSPPDPASGFMAAMIASCTELSCAVTAAVSDSRR
jgi:hypothetical protein